MQLGYHKISPHPFSETLERVRKSLEAEGFGVVSEIDAQTTFQKKMNVAFPSYVILGACHAPTALGVLTADREMGHLLPCNVLVYDQDGQIAVSAVRPSVVMSVAEHPELRAHAEDIEAKLQRVVDAAVL